MATSGVEEAAMRLLGAFYDLSGHNPAVSVPLGTSREPGPRTAAKAADMEPGSTECDVALRYLLNQRYVEEGGAPSEFEITVMGIDRVRETRGLG
jgi:hypothetical protein